MSGPMDSKILYKEKPEEQQEDPKMQRMAQANVANVVIAVFYY